MHAEAAPRLLPAAVREIPRGFQRVHHLRRPPRAAGEAGRVHAQRAGQALGQPQDHGPMALPLLQLPRSVLHPAAQPRAVEGRGHALLPRPRVLRTEEERERRGAGAGGQGTRRRASRPRAR